jgi:hypothetical protein
MSAATCCGCRPLASRLPWAGAEIHEELCPRLQRTVKVCAIDVQSWVLFYGISSVVFSRLAMDNNLAYCRLLGPMPAHIDPRFYPYIQYHYIQSVSKQHLTCTYECKTQALEMLLV